MNTVHEIYSSSTNSWSAASKAPFFFPYYHRTFTSYLTCRILVPSTGEAPNH